MAKTVNVGDQIDLGEVGYVRLPDDAVVTSGRFYMVRHEGKHVAFGTEEVEYNAVDASKKVTAEAVPPASPKPASPKK